MVQPANLLTTGLHFQVTVYVCICLRCPQQRNDFKHSHALSLRLCEIKVLFAKLPWSVEFPACLTSFIMMTARRERPDIKTVVVYLKTEPGLKMPWKEASMSPDYKPIVPPNHLPGTPGAPGGPRGPGGQGPS